MILANKGKQGLALGHRWKPGQSGNPSGRPKGVAEIAALARSYCERGVKDLAEMATTAPDLRIRVEAWKVLLDRGLGRPLQQVDANVTQVGLEAKPTPEILGILKEAKAA